MAGFVGPTYIVTAHDAVTGRELYGQDDDAPLPERAEKGQVLVAVPRGDRPESARFFDEHGEIGALPKWDEDLRPTITIDGVDVKCSPLDVDAIRILIAESENDTVYIETMRKAMHVRDIRSGQMSLDHALATLGAEIVG